MCKAMRCWIFLAIVSVLLAGSLVLAEGKAKGRGDKPLGWVPPGLSKEEQAEWKDGRPPGWSRGEKEGWKGGELPPGWEKWNDEKKKGWEKEIREAKGKMRANAKRLKDFSAEDLDSALISVEAAGRKGVPIKHARGLVKKAMEKGIRGKGIETATKAMAYGVGKEINFDQLSKFVYKKLDEGLRDDELSIEIYKEVVRRHGERLKAKEAIQQKREKGKGKEK